MSDLNIEYTGRLYDAAKLRRFAGKVYDRVARSSRIMLSVFIVVGLAAEVLAYLRGGHLDLYLLFLLALIVFALKFNRARFQKSMDLVIRRFMGDSDEGTVAITDTCYEFRSGDNVMRVVWRNLGSYYVFLDGGLAVLERNLPTLLLPSLVSLGASEEEVKSALEKAGLKDYRHCRSYWWVFALLAALMGGVVAQFDLMQSRAKMPAPACVECDDEEEDEEDENPFADDDSGGGKSRQFSLGDIDFDSLVKLVEKYFGHIKPRERKVSHYDYDELTGSSITVNERRDVPHNAIYKYFMMPGRFDADYVGADGEKHRPIMIHRVVYGSIERFIGILIEHYAGKFPVWLSPVQVKVLTVSDKYLEYAQHIVQELKDKEVRAELDDRNEKLGYKIREARMDKVPYIIIVGEKEQENGTISVRSRDAEEGKQDLGEMQLPELIERI